MDILGELPETDKGNKYILVVTNGFTKWTQAIPLPDQTAQVVADALIIDDAGHQHVWCPTSDTY